MLLLLFIAFMLALIVGFDRRLLDDPVRVAGRGVPRRCGRSGDDAPVDDRGRRYLRAGQVPLFILAGELMNRGGLTLRLIDWAQAMVGRVKGSLGHVFHPHQSHHGRRIRLGCCRCRRDRQPLIPAMKREKYGEGFAGAVIAAGALLGPIIPPSIPMVVYAQLSSQSVGQAVHGRHRAGSAARLGFMGVCVPRCPAAQLSEPDRQCLGRARRRRPAVPAGPC